MGLAQELALLADTLRDVSAGGLYYEQDVYNRARYKAVQDVSVRLFAIATGAVPEQIEALRLQGL